MAAASGEYLLQKQNKQSLTFASRLNTCCRSFAAEETSCNVIVIAN